MSRWRIWLPFAGFVLLVAVIATGLFAPADRTVRSAMVNKPLPAFDLPPIVASKPGLAARDFAKGQPRLLNVFASWCIPCIAEAPHLMRLKQMGVQIDAVAIRDNGPAVAEFLGRHGDPYAAIGSDVDGQVQIALGSSGVPETFVVDGNGRIRLQHIGEIRAADIPDLLSALEAAK